VNQESTEIILKYIEKHSGRITKNNVVKYMENILPEEKRISRVPTFEIINELEGGDRIIVKRGKRQGQSHILFFNDKSDFDRINRELSHYAELIKKVNNLNDKTERVIEDRILHKLVMTLADTQLHIKNERDKLGFDRRILDLMLLAKYKGKLLEA